MTGLEALQSVQFVTVEGRRFAVVEGGDWESLVEWLEQIEDVQAARLAYQSLEDASGDREKAGWLRWDEIEGELDNAGVGTFSFDWLRLASQVYSKELP